MFRRIHVANHHRLRLGDPAIGDLDPQGENGVARRLSRRHVLGHHTDECGCAALRVRQHDLVVGQAGGREPQPFGERKPRRVFGVL